MRRLAAVLAMGLPALAHAAERVYQVDGSASTFRIAVGRAGLFSFAGHTHEVLASGIEGRVVADPEDLARSAVTLRFPAAGLRVTGKGEPAEDVAKVQAKMEGPDVLDVARFDEVVFRSTGVEGREAGGVWNLRVAGELTLRGVTRPQCLEVTLNALKRHPLPPFRRTAGFSATATLSRADFGITAWKNVIGDSVELRIEAEAVRDRAGNDDDATPVEPAPADAVPDSTPPDSTPTPEPMP